MARVWVTDDWFSEKRDDAGKKIPKAQHGKGARWRVQWYEPHPDGTNKMRSKSFKKRHDADAFAAKTEDALREGSYQSAEDASRTVGDAVEAWMTSKSRPKPSSIGTYRDRIDNYVLPRWQHVRLSAVTRLDIDHWTADLQTGSATVREGMRGAGRPLSPSTVKNILMPLNAALRYAVQEGWLRRNPATGVETPRGESDPIVYLSYPELERLIEHVKDAASAQDALMVAIMGNTGLRPGEVYALAVGDVDLRARRIHVSKTLTTNGTHATVLGSSPKTRAGFRAVPVPPHLVTDLRKQMGRRAKGAPLFPTTTGTHLSPTNWRNRVFSPAVRAAGVPHGLTPKGLRHTAASLAIAAGADVLMVQRMLGHADAKETLNTYAKLFPDRLDEVTDRMSKARTKALEKAQKMRPKN